MKRNDLTISNVENYELLDSGDGRKLEIFSGIILDRPEPQAIWNKLKPKDWTNSNAQFLWAQKGERWSLADKTPESWTFNFNLIKLELSFKGFKHVGVFPEHADQWKDIIKLGQKNKNLKMLNLFGYTGAASIAGVLGGMNVTHVDASKQTINTLKENIKLSGLDEKSIRVICEDALRYTKRLIERKENFDVIILDPPAFGRGPKGEVWKIEESLKILITLIPEILSENVKLVILNGYASGYSARTFGELLKEVLGSRDGDITYGDIGIKHSGNDRVLTTGIYTKWQK